MDKISLLEYRKADIQSRILYKTERVKLLGKRNREIADCLSRGFKDDELIEKSVQLEVEIGLLSDKILKLMQILDAVNVTLRQLKLKEFE